MTCLTQGNLGLLIILALTFFIVGAICGVKWG